MMIVAAMGGTYVSLGFDLTTVDGVIQWGIVVTTEITLTSVMIARGVDQVAEREAARRRAERLARSEDETMVIRTAWTS